MSGERNGADTVTDVTEEIARLKRRALQFLLHSFLYYRLGESLIGDDGFDRVAEELRALRTRHPAAEMPHAKVIDPVLGPESSGHRIRRYPPEIVTTAFKLLFAATDRKIDFTEFVERRGYRVAEG